MFVNQSIRTPLGVTVFGSSMLRVEPDIARVDFTVCRVHKEPQVVLDAVREAVEKVREVLRDLGVGESCVQVSRVDLETAFTGRYEERKFAGYEGTASISVLVEDLGITERLLVDVVEAGAHLIDGVEYMTSRLKELREEARVAAVKAAKKKAELYAKAAEVELGSVVHIEDVNPEQLRRRSHTPDIDISDHGDEPLAGLLSGSITISGAVMATFAILG